MKTPTMLSLLALTANLLAATLANAAPREGGIHGGGGKGVLCKTADGDFRSLEVLDLYESRVQFKSPPLIDRRPMLEQARDAKARLDKAVPPGKKSFIKNPEAVFKQFVFIPDAALKDTQDSNEIIVPRGCDIVQLANYSSDGQIYVDGSLWEKMDETNRAALLMHEAVYKSFRARFGDQDSTRARRAVGHVFSGKSFEPPQVRADAYRCAIGHKAITKDDWQPRQPRETSWDPYGTWPSNGDMWVPDSWGNEGTEFLVSFGPQGVTLDIIKIADVPVFGRSAIRAAFPQRSVGELEKATPELSEKFFFKNIESPVNANVWASYAFDGVSNGTINGKNGTWSGKLLHLRLDLRSIDNEAEPVEEYVCWPLSASPVEK